MRYVLVLILIIAVAFAQTCLMDKRSQATVTQPPKVLSAPARSSAFNTEEVLRKRLGMALANHPDAQVRNEFFPLLRDSKIIIAWAQGPLSGHFTLVPPEKLRPHRTGTDPVPALVIAPHLLSDPREAMMLRLVIYHEFIHYLQWVNKRWPEEMFILKTVDETKNLDELCKQKWYAEMEAYQKECAFARKIGALKLLPFCTADGELSHDQYKEAMRGDPMAPFCSNAWSSL